MKQRLKMITMVRSTRVQDAEQPFADLTIRRLTSEDVGIFGELLFEAFKDSVHQDRWKTSHSAVSEARRVLQQLPIQFDIDASFIALSGETPVSVSVVSAACSGPYLTYIGTIRQFRRCGIVGELVNRSLKVLYGKGIIDVYLNVATKNRNALSRYRSLGFEAIDLKR
jgi:ribosomal protein S18 acetylase RimI-like enzyme